MYDEVAVLFVIKSLNGNIQSQCGFFKKSNHPIVASSSNII